MTHCSEDDLILHYYGELPSQRDLTQHLDTCAECAAAYQAIADTMRLVAIPDVPGRGDAYGREVWQQIRARLPERPAPAPGTTPEDPIGSLLSQLGDNQQKPAPDGQAPK